MTETSNSNGTRTDVSIVISGAAGQGIQTVERVALALFKALGLHVYATKEYMSRVRGGTTSTAIRIAGKPVQSFVSRIDVLIPFSEESLLGLSGRITESTTILLEPNLVDRNYKTSANVVHVPLFKTAKELGNRLYSNTVAAGVLAGLFGLDLDRAKEEIRELFARKGEKVVEGNVNAVAAGYELGTNLDMDIACPKKADEGSEEEVAVNGSQAVALGAIAGGCNMITSYPMSPGTAVLTYLSAKAKEFEIVAEQVEDEISAINMAIGGWFGGGRAMVTTSGGGFALMEEGISLAGMTETPVVVHLAQRPGPATGLPTRTEQGDLEMVLYAGHGEFPRIILSPGTLTEGFELTRQAFDLADRFQVPVFVLTDQYFVDTYYDFYPPEIPELDRRAHIIESDESYQRYSLTDDGVSPRAIPGFGRGIPVVSGNEHLEDGHITEDADVRVRMTSKRLRKMKAIEEYARDPEISGADAADTAVICWGSTYPMVRDAVAERNLDVQVIHFSQVYPLSVRGRGRLKRVRRRVMVEQNATGQFERILLGHYGITMDDHVRKFDGRPFSVEELGGQLEQVIKGGQA